jgi:DNA polymerase III subunit delta'
MNGNHVIQEVKLKQNKLASQFINIINNNELSHSYLFSGDEGIGKLSLALFVIMKMFCVNPSDDGFPCGQCNECCRITNHQHPDVIMVKPDGHSIKINQIRYLQSEFSKSGLEGNQKFFIIQDADKMTTSAANSLLKFIEEPNQNVVSFLLTANCSLILPTIISRSQVIELSPLDANMFNETLVQLGFSKNQFKLVKRLTNQITIIKEWAETEWIFRMIDYVGNWFEFIAAGNAEAFIMIQTEIMPYIVDEKQKQALINMLLSVFEDVLDAKYLATTDFSFAKHTKAIENLSRHVSDQQLIDIIGIVLECNAKMMINISLKSILEVMTLRILKILE